MAKSRTGLDHRHRDESGRIERKHGNTKVASLRKEYGPGFAKGRRKDMMPQDFAGRDRFLIAARLFEASPQIIISPDRGLASPIRTAAGSLAPPKRTHQSVTGKSRPLGA
jgi:hypothetical protein